MLMFLQLHVEATVPHPIIGLDCKGLLNQVGRGKRVIPLTAKPTASDKDREALVQELKAQMPKSDFKGDKSHSQTESQTRRLSTENLIINKEGKNLEQSMETEASDQGSYFKGDNHQPNMTLEDDDDITQVKTSSDIETLNPHPIIVKTANTLMEFVLKPRQTLSITEPYHGSSTILSRLLSSIVEPTEPARVNIRDLNPQDHFVVNACTFYMSFKSQDDSLILPRRDETFWWNEPEAYVTLNPDTVNRVIKKQQTLIPFHLDIDNVWSEMKSNGDEYMELAKIIYNHVEEGRECGILSAKLKVCQI